MGDRRVGLSSVNRGFTFWLWNFLLPIGLIFWNFSEDLHAEQEPTEETTAVKYSGRSVKSGWPHLRGPSYDAISSETAIADSWPAAGPPVLWTAELGDGYSGLIAVNDRLFTQTQTLYGQYVVCIDAENGQQVWKYRYGWPYEGAGMYPGPRATPTYHEERIYFSGPRGVVGCLDANDGQLFWSVNVLEKFHGRGSDFGYSCSPLVIDTKVILPVGGKGASVVALDSVTGKTIWQSGDEPSSYCSAIPISVKGDRFIVAFLQNSLALFDLVTGEQVWQQGYSQGYDEHAAFPVFQEPYLMIASPFRDGAKLYKIDVEQPGDQLKVDSERKVSVDEVWQSQHMSNDVASSILIDGSIYGFDIRDMQAKLHRPSRGFFRCLDLLTGKVHWSNEETGHVSVIAADGKLILLNDEGKLILARASPDRYEELGRANIFGGEACWTPPTLNEGRLFLRKHSRVVCLYVGQQERLSKVQLASSKSVSEIPKLKSRSLERIIGSEREFPFDLPRLGEMKRWYLYCMFGVFGVAVVGSVPFHLVGRFHWSQQERFVTHVVFWITTFLYGVAATPLYNRLSEKFILTWPVVLFVAFQLTTLTISWAEKQEERKKGRRISRLMGLLFLCVCVLYFHVCRSSSLIMQWVFLVGFVFSYPVVILAARRILLQKGLVSDLFWILVSFSVYFWSCSIFTLWNIIF